MRASRIRLIEIIVAASVVVISVASLFVAVFQGYVMQRTLEAQVIPVVQYDTGNYDRDRDEWRMVLSLTNTGLGPAEIRSFEIGWREDPLNEPADLIARCCLPTDVPQGEARRYIQSVFQAGEMRFFSDGVEGRFLAPQETVNFVTFPRPDAQTQMRGRAIWDALDGIKHEIEVDICYCSVFEDCWRAGFPDQSREPVTSCAG